EVLGAGHDDREREHVTGQDELGLVDGRAEDRDDPRQGDVHDRRVEHDHERAERDADRGLPHVVQAVKTALLPGKRPGNGGHRLPAPGCSGERGGRAPGYTLFAQRLHTAGGRDRGRDPSTGSARQGRRDHSATWILTSTEVPIARRGSGWSSSILTGRSCVTFV